MKYEYGVRDHRGGLKERLETKCKITEQDFKKLLPYYEYYCFDKRVNQFLWILKDIEKNYKKYFTWLYIEIKENKNDTKR